MKFIKIFFTLILLYTFFGIPYSFANSISPSITEVKLPQGQRSISSVKYENQEEKDIEISLKVYEYNPKMDEIYPESKNIFLKVDTDTTVVKANTTSEIKYEIVPLSNQDLGTYFNILVISQVHGEQNVYINKGISQLVILHIVDQYDDVKGITTEDFRANIEVVSKGIPFLTPLELKYTIYNDSQYVIVPSGRIEVLNKKSDYKPEYIYINQEKGKVYPGELYKKEIEIDNWHISDLFSEKYALLSFTNGLDNIQKQTDVSIRPYTIEIFGILGGIVLISLLVKSIKEDKKKN